MPVDAGALIGEYRVAGAGGLEVDLDWAITLSITADRIALQSQCVTPSWRYAYSDGAISTEAIPMPICERALAPVEQAAIDALDGATTVRRSPANAVVLEGAGRAITLFSQ
ncbi:hypothetical protein J4558_04170 [Leptolyngbya sp. 15MV]|nr:hypothetical protein J4558_04170 [Leptolyngbya sp. 15MV]